MAKQARAPEQKEQRRAAILTAAENLLAGSAYDHLTMADVAAAAGLAKGTVYLYFPSKDDLFLSLLTERQCANIAALDQALDEIAGKLPDTMSGRCAALAAMLAEGMTADPLLVRLEKLAINTLEAGAQFETILAYKTALFQAIGSPAAKLAALMGADETEDGMRLVTLLHALMLGFTELGDLPETIKEATRQAGRGDLIDLKQDGLADAFATVLRGFAAEVEGNSD